MGWLSEYWPAVHVDLSNFLELQMKYSRLVISSGLMLGLLGLAACQSHPMMTQERESMHQQRMQRTSQQHHMMTSTLLGSNEVPATMSTGSGAMELALNHSTRVLTWTVAYQGLSGAATGAHFHSPAFKDQNAGIVVPILGSLVSPFVGAIILTDDQIADLMAGKWYVNVHTASYPGGEIRGQITSAP
jgi:CHRD domain